MSLDESSVLMDRALVTMCQELPESLGLYNTAKDQFSLAAIRGVPLLESVGPDSRKLVLIRDWMRAYEPAEDQPLSAEISMDSLKETDRRERKERERQLQEEKHAQLTSESAAESDDRKRRKRQRKKDKAAAKERERATKAKAKGKDKNRAKPKKAAAKQKKAKSKQSSGKTRASSAGGRKRHVQLDSDDDVLSIEESSSTSEESSSESSDSSDSDSDSRAKKRKKASAGNLPPKEVVLSSDEDDEPNEMFDTDDPDVYEVEKILRKKAGASYGDPDLYEVKWEGYDETTWEPAGNISKDLIDEFEGQPVREDVYTVEEIVDRRSKRDPITRLKTYQYKVKWVGYDDLTWEPAENLPHNLRRKFDQKYENRKRRRS